MSQEYNNILKHALELPQSEFFALVQVLLGKVQDKIEDNTGVTRMPWETNELFTELDKRMEEIQSGNIEAVPGAEIMARLKKRMT